MLEALQVADVVLTIGLFLGRDVLKAQAIEKGKNLAIEQDIEPITSKVEHIRTEYLAQPEEIGHQNRLVTGSLNRRYQLRLGALERRLETHQLAFAFLWDLKYKVSLISTTNKLQRTSCSVNNGGSRTVCAWTQTRDIIIEPRILQQSIIEASLRLGTQSW